MKLRSLLIVIFVTVGAGGSIYLSPDHQQVFKEGSTTELNDTAMVLSTREGFVAEELNLSLAVGHVESQIPLSAPVFVPGTHFHAVNVFINLKNGRWGTTSNHQEGPSGTLTRDQIDRIRKIQTDERDALEAVLADTLYRGSRFESNKR